jgi:hypothetical protein
VRAGCGERRAAWVPTEAGGRQRMRPLVAVACGGRQPCLRLPDASLAVAEELYKRLGATFVPIAGLPLPGLARPMAAGHRTGRGPGSRRNEVRSAITVTLTPAGARFLTGKLLVDVRRETEF